MRLHKITWKVGGLADWNDWERLIVEFLGIDMEIIWCDDPDSPVVNFLY